MAGHRVGLIGLGNMGGRIARRIAAAGHEVLGHDLDPKAAPAAGVTPAATIAEAVRGADSVLMSLPDDAAVEAVVLGEGGVLDTVRAGQVVADLGTSSPARTARLHAVLAGRGVEYLDAGVSGGPAAADAGTLTIMAGGSPAALARLDGLFRAFAAKIFHLGGSGAGHTAKLLNNFLNATTLSATAEVMVAGRAAGLNPATLLDVINASSGASYASRHRFPAIIRGDYLEGGLTGALMMKDLVLYVDLLRTLGVPSLHAAGPMAGFGLAGRLGYGDRVSNRVVDALGDVAGGIRIQGEAS
ncbi:3-hydroxyisobutyrate dehydrogenase [Microtetraspora sp. NBRC 13810]|uniref:NAD(P)-dependent oxidoreductase n=1 Tax=Microtetraspora sp. NBRC 13810 TaxID=3030990 RepID=UPI0024A0BD49|nr:NAD(P)-dependent oxidoreductase [Microtetraspora sp. NBRC 13810]GLW06663.1 3-hydroxyisobutyrate dehydrogenase [Microtetraspora sp. NBRC 13810]